MDIDLKQGLGDIADDAATSHLDPDSLWRSGVRRRNRRRAGGALVALAAVVAVGAGALLVPEALDRAAPPVASEQRAAALPDRLWSPSPWTRSTDDSPPGRIAALFWDNTTRRTAWGRGSQGYVAVSAYDGSYRYVDAPGLAEVQRFNAEPSLSPDGRYVAYPGPHLRGRAVTGWRVYDAETGEVLSYEVDDAPLGVSAQTPTWTPDSSTLVVSLCPLRELTEATSSCLVEDALSWDVTRDRARVIPHRSWLLVQGDAADRPLVMENRKVGTLDVATGATTTVGRVAVPEQGVTGAHLGADGRTLTLASPTAEDNDTAVGLFDASVSGGPTGPVAPATQRAEVIGTYVKSLAVHDGTAVAWVSTKGGNRIVTLRPDGQTPTLVRVPKDFTGFVPILASDLAAQPTKDFGEPDQPRDPRLTGAAGMLGLGVVVAVLVSWRRRRVSGWARA